MARDTVDTTPLEGRAQLLAAVEDGCKPKDQWRIGTEHEKFGFYKSDFSPVPYEGDNGIRAVLEGMKAKTGWDPIIDAGNIITECMISR